MPLHPANQKEIERLLLAVLSRDHRRDIECLNQLLARQPGGNAGFRESPPMPFSGDPFNLTVGNCIAVIGLNPRWQSDKKSNHEYSQIRECFKAIQGDGADGLRRYRNLRASYFNENSEIYYGEYFTRLGNYIGKHLLDLPVRERELKSNRFAKRVFREHVFKTDFLPWLSENTDAIDWENAGAASCEALQEYHTWLLRFLEFLNPKWIECNGLSTRKNLEMLFDVELKEKKVYDKFGRCCRFYYQRARIGSNHIPILVHPFVNRVDGMTFTRIAAAFKDFMYTNGGEPKSKVFSPS